MLVPILYLKFWLYKTKLYWIDLCIRSFFSIIDLLQVITWDSHVLNCFLIETQFGNVVFENIISGKTWLIQGQKEQALIKHFSCFLHNLKTIFEYKKADQGKLCLLLHKLGFPRWLHIYRKWSICYWGAKNALFSIFFFEVYTVLVIIKLTKNAVQLRFCCGSCKLKCCLYFTMFWDI